MNPIALKSVKKLSAVSVLAVADRQLGKGLGGMLAVDGSQRRAHYDRRRKAWIVTYDADPAIYYRLNEEPDGTPWMERIA